MSQGKHRPLAALLVLGLAAGAYGVADAFDIAPGLLTTRPALAPPATYGPAKTPTLSAEAPPAFDGQEAPLSENDFAAAVAGFTTDKRLGAASVSLHIEDLDGKSLADYHGEKAMVAASSTKVLTAAAALETLGPETRLRTAVAWDSKTRTLYLIGGGDMLLGEGQSDPNAISGHLGLATLASQTLAALQREAKSGGTGDKSAAGGLVTALQEGDYKLHYDTTYFGNESYNPEWKDDEARWIGAVQGLAINTGYSDQARWLYYPNPAQRSAEVFAAALTGAGAPAPTQITSGKWPGGAAEIVNPLGDEPSVEVSGGKGSGVVAWGTSATVAQIIRPMLKHSDNTLAEGMGRLVALARDGKATYAGAGHAVMQALAETGIDLGETELKGCSGLANTTKIPARTLAAVVRASLRGEGKLAALATNLPVAGADGTLAKQYRNSATAGILRAKTGSLQGVSTLTGSFVRGGQVAVFCLEINGITGAEQWQIPGAKEDLFKALAGQPVTWQPRTAPEAGTAPAGQEGAGQDGTAQDGSGQDGAQAVAEQAGAGQAPPQ